MPLAPPRGASHAIPSACVLHETMRGGGPGRGGSALVMPTTWPEVGPSPAAERARTSTVCAVPASSPETRQRGGALAATTTCDGAARRRRGVGGARHAAARRRARARRAGKSRFRGRGEAMVGGAAPRNRRRHPRGRAGNRLALAAAMSVR